MKVAIIGSRNLRIDIEKYLREIEEQLSEKITMIISGGARGIDTQAEEYADTHNIPKLIFLPDYKKYDKYAPLLRNIDIIKKADVVIAFWDGKSRGTKFVIQKARIERKKLIVYKVIEE